MASITSWVAPSSPGMSAACQKYTDASIVDAPNERSRTDGAGLAATRSTLSTAASSTSTARGRSVS